MDFFFQCLQEISEVSSIIFFCFVNEETEAQRIYLEQVQIIKVFRGGVNFESGSASLQSLFSKLFRISGKTEPFESQGYAKKSFNVHESISGDLCNFLDLRNYST